MAKYYLDTEFLEGTQAKYYIKGIPFGKTKPTIDLISIGIVCEDGRELYELCKDCNLDEAWYRTQIETNWYQGIGTQNKVYWIRNNVLRKIYEEYIPTDPENNTFEFTLKTMKQIFKELGRTREELADKIKEFVLVGSLNSIRAIDNQKEKSLEYWANKYPPKFYAYYSDYDWVGFCWIFGKMSDLPKGFPYYCNDLKQLFDDKLDEKLSLHCYLTIGGHRKQFDAERINNGDLTEIIEWVTGLDIYPTQDKEHSAIEDAKWDRDFHKFILENL